MTPFNIVTNILTSKSKLEYNSEFEKGYVPYVINKAISFHSDCIFHAELSTRLMSSVPKNIQYQYYYECFPKRKRYSKWEKSSVNEEDVKMIKKVYGTNTRKSLEILSLLSSEQLKTINSIHGGKNISSMNMFIGI